MMSLCVCVCVLCRSWEDVHDAGEAGRAWDHGSDSERSLLHDGTEQGHQSVTASPMAYLEVRERGRERDRERERERDRETVLLY